MRVSYNTRDEAAFASGELRLNSFKFFGNETDDIFQKKQR